MNIIHRAAAFGTAFGLRKPLLQRELTICDVLKSDQLRLLIFADEFGPTVQINWTKPLQAARGAEACALWLIEEKRLEAALSGRDKATAMHHIDALIIKMRPDAVVLCRYGGKRAGRILKVARRRRIPTIFHIDDNLLSVSKEMGKSKHRKYSDPARQKALRILLTRADLVYCSTAELLRQILALPIHPRSSFVGEIAAAADVVGPSSSLEGETREHLTIGYMASRSHSQDLELVCHVLERILDEMPHVRFELFGSIETPSRLLGRVARRYEAAGNYDEFLNRLASLRWDVGIAPLRLTAFNLAKTNTKWVEYTAAGIPVVCSRNPVYAKIAAENGVIEADGPEEWYNVLRQLLLDAARRDALRRQAKLLLERKYSVRHLTTQVSAVLAAIGLSEKTAKFCQMQNHIDNGLPG